MTDTSDVKAAYPAEQPNVAIYAIGAGLKETGFVRLAVSRLAQTYDRVEVFLHWDEADRYAALLGDIPSLYMRCAATALGGAMPLYRAAMTDLFAKSDLPKSVLLTGSHVFGPVATGAAFELPINADVLAPYWHGCHADPRLDGARFADRVPVFDHTVFGENVLRDRGFQSLWRDMMLTGDAWHDHVNGALRLGQWLVTSGYAISYAVSHGALGAAEPWLYEAGTALKNGSPCLSAQALHLDPVLHDLNASTLRDAFDFLRSADQDLYKHAMAYALRHLKLRDFCTIADQYEVLPEQHEQDMQEGKGTIPYAVFIHAYYAEMMQEFWQLVQSLPGRPHLFLTTANSANANTIIQFLKKRQWPKNRVTVRVVEQNRGRDMSALFITWRDVALGGKFDIALRLHSKKTPQVPHQVGKEFKSHLFDNLVGPQSQSAAILHMLLTQPDIGLIIPPVIHQGFGTLGHAWFNNKAPLLKQAQALGLDVPFDDNTPVAPYGTMFWFRPDALHKLFAHDWRWEDYNPEPHHVDGGLAHVQERMIGYCAQDRGYRVVQVMGARHAARLYGRIEYKAQLYAAQYLSNNIADHRAEMERRTRVIRRRLYTFLRYAYGAMLKRFPTSRHRLRPIKATVISLLMGRF